MVVTFPPDGEGCVGFLKLERLRIPIAGDLGSKPVGGIQYPGVPRFAGEERQFAGSDKACVAFARPALNVMHFSGKIEFHQSLRYPSGLIFFGLMSRFPDFSRVKSNTIILGSTIVLQFTLDRAPEHFLYFFPLPQGQGSLRPIFARAARAGMGADVDREGVWAALQSCNEEDSFHRLQYEMLCQ